MVSEIVTKVIRLLNSTGHSYGGNIVVHEM